MIHRRKLLAGLVAGASSGFFSRSGLATPQVLRSFVNDTDHYRLSTVWDHARTPLENTAKLQELVDWLSSSRKQLWVDRGNGRPYLIAPATPSWREFSPDSLPASRAVTIRNNDFHLVGDGGRIVMVAMPGGQPQGKNYAFSTLQNMTIGTVRNVTIEGNPYDWDSAISFVPNGLRSNYMLCLCGVRGIRISNALVANSAQQKRGAFAAVYNCADLQVIDLELRHLQQGFNLNYVEDIVFRRIKARVFSEVVDANFPIDRAVFEDLDGDNLGSERGESQFLDLVGSDIRVSGVRVRNQAGNAIAAYTKGKAWPTYAQHVEHGTVLNPNPRGLENIVIENVQAENAGLAAGYPLVMLGNRRDERVEGVGGVVDGVTYRPFPVARNITLRNVRGRSTSGVAIFEGTDLRVENVVLEDCFGGAVSEFFAFRVGQQTKGPNARRISHFSGVIRDVQVRGARFGGILIDGPGEVVAENVHCEGWGSAGGPDARGTPPSGIRVANLGLKPGRFSFAKFTALDTREVGSSASLQLSGPSGRSEVQAIAIEDHGGHRLTGVQPFAVSADITGRFTSFTAIPLSGPALQPAGQARALSAGNLQVTVRTQERGRKSRLLRAELIVNEPRARSSLRSPVTLLKRKVDLSTVTLGVFPPIGDAPDNSGSTLILVGNRNAGEAEAVFAEGEALILSFTGGGEALPGMSLKLLQPEWASG